MHFRDAMIDACTKTRTTRNEEAMQIEGSSNEKDVETITDVIKEHYEESLAMLISVNVTNVLDDRIYIVQTVSAWEGDDEYTIHTETIRADMAEGLTLTLLSENDLDLREEL